MAQPLPGLRVSKAELAAEDRKRGRGRKKGVLSRRKKPWFSRTPGDRGWVVRGSGQTAVVQSALEWRGTTRQICGMWPFAGGSSLPPIGAPLGTHLLTGATVSADPMSWFVGQIINVPSGFVLGRPSVGKSTLVRRMLAFLDWSGVIPMILADLKPDYRYLVEREMGGKMVPVGEVTTSDDGRTTVGHINPLDLLGHFGNLAELDYRVRAWAVDKLLSQQINVLQGILEIANQGHPLTGQEVSVLAGALRILQIGEDRQPLPGPAPTIRDVLAVLSAKQPEGSLKAKLLVEKDEEFHAETRNLRILLTALLEGGQFGAVFDGPTQHLDLDRPGGFDVSAIDDEDHAKQAAVQLACWSYGVTSIALKTRMADLGLAPRKRYMLVMDELWRLLRASNTLVYRVDKLTRINREMGVGQVMITHTMDDLKLGSEELTRIAWGFVGRSSMVFCGGLVGGEFGNLEEVFALSRREKAMITDWAAEGGFDPASGKGTGPRGRGKFLMKLGKEPGIPYQVNLTDRERRSSDTNRRWDELAVHDDSAEVAR